MEVLKNLLIGRSLYHYGKYAKQYLAGAVKRCSATTEFRPWFGSGCAVHNSAGRPVSCGGSGCRHTCPPACSTERLHAWPPACSNERLRARTTTCSTERLRARTTTCSTERSRAWTPARSTERRHFRGIATISTHGRPCCRALPGEKAGHTGN